MTKRAKAARLGLMVGVAASRTGLWLFDMAVTRMFQEFVEPGELGESEAAIAELMLLSPLPASAGHAHAAFPGGKMSPCHMSDCTGNSG